MPLVVPAYALDSGEIFVRQDVRDQPGSPGRVVRMVTETKSIQPEEAVAPVEKGPPVEEPVPEPLPTSETLDAPRTGVRLSTAWSVEGVLLSHDA